MNPIDRVVHFFNPQAGEQRIRARARAAAVMNFDAASRGRRTYGWKSPATAADAAAYASRARLRQLSRDMVRNRPYAARAQMVVRANVVGTGIVPTVTAKTAKGQKIVADLVARHLLTPAIDAGGEYDLYEMQDLVMAGVFTDGEVLARRRWRNTRYNPGLPMPFQIELLEPDHLDTSVTSWGTNLVIEGVEYGPTGAIEAYHLYDEHPGAVLNRKALQSRRVHWSDVLHIRRFDRPGQLRGVPWLAPVMMTMGEVSDYQESQLLKQRMAALLAVFIEWDDDAKRPADVGSGLEEMQPGAVVNLPPGAKANFTEPPSVGEFDGFMRRNLQAVASGISITYESLTGDLGNVNFSSARMGRTEMDRAVSMWRRNLMIQQFCHGVARWFNEALPLMGHPSIVAEFVWTPPRRMLIDPTKEVPAMIDEIEAGVTSRQRVQRELGYDPDVIRQERVEDAKKDKRDGLAAPAPRSAAPENGTKDAAGDMAGNEGEEDDTTETGEDEDENGL